VLFRSFLRSYLNKAHPVRIEKHTFIIGFDPEFEDHVMLVDQPRNHAVLQTKLKELGHPDLKFRFIKAETPVQYRGSSEPIPEEPPAPAARPAQAPTQTPAQKAKPAAAPPVAAKEKTVTVPFSKEEFKNDPLIQKALEVFKGQIVQVRA
jgi:DNA polymerase-3 subunit gamma/tau